MNGSGLKWFKGKNIITFNPSQFTRTKALEHFIDIKKNHLNDPRKNGLVRIDLDLNNENLHYQQKRENSAVGFLNEFTLNGNGATPKKTEVSSAPPIFIKKKINKIKLSTPFLNSDKRWRTVGLTAAPLFLGSELIKNGYSIELENISLPVSKQVNIYTNTDISGFTLFEDIFIHFREFLDTYPPNPAILTAAGGPLISLSPLSAMYHLPELNLFVRGEGKQCFPNYFMRSDQVNLKNFYCCPVGPFRNKVCLFSLIMII